MKTPHRELLAPPRTAARALAIVRTALLVVLASTMVEAQDLVVDGDMVHTMAGDPIPDGRVVILDGRVAVVGPAASVAIPDGVPVLRAAVVTPGLIDTHTTVGLTGVTNQDEDQDHLDHNEALQPELRALDSYNARDPIVAWLASFGITTVHTGHAPGAVVSGQTMIVKTRPGTVEDALVEPVAMVAVTLGDQATREGEGLPKGSPGTRARAVAMLRQALVDAQGYTADGGGERNLRHEVMARVLAGELPLLITAHKHHDIQAALRLADEFGVRVVLDGAAEAYLLTDQISAAGVPVLVHPPMMRTGGAASATANASFETAAILHQAGIPIGSQSGFEDYVPKVRVAVLEAAISARYGLPWEATLASLTSEAARILGVDDRLGTLEVGKHGDLALFDGDPFEYTTHCVGAVIEGVVVSDVTR